MADTQYAFKGGKISANNNVLRSQFVFCVIFVVFVGDKGKAMSHGMSSLNRWQEKNARIGMEAGKL